MCKPKEKTRATGAMKGANYGGQTKQASAPLTRVGRWVAAVWLGLVCVWGSAAHAALPSPQQVRAAHHSSETLVLDRHGQPLHRLRTNAQLRRGDWVALEDMSHALRLALVASEDRRFYAHSGVDWQAVSAAAWGNVWNSRTRGASTLTMQLAGLLDDDLRIGAQGRSLRQKLGQAVAAQQLERTWRKDEILEAYLNLVPLRGELVGIDALSRTLLGKAPHGLDSAEAAIAVALIRGPNAKADVVARRACQVLRDMAHLDTQSTADVDCTAVQWRTPQVLAARRWATSEGEAPHWARRAWRQAQADGGEGHAMQTLYTTLDADVQRAAHTSLQRHLRELHGHGVEDGAVLVLDNASGQVLAWVGSSGSLSQAQEVDGVQALRQPGSTLKPFLYAQALQQQRLTAASLLHDAPVHLPTAAGLYVPQNYDRHFKGWVSVRTALAASLNVPAVRALVMVTPDAFHQQLHQLGLELPQPAGYYGYSLALGSPEVSLLALTNAYRALANGGRWQPVAPALLSAAYEAPAQEAAAREALSSQAAFIVGDILSDASARAMTFGLDSVLATRHWTAVKTGTSKDMRDNWAVGWSQHYTVGVWVGNASGRAMHRVSGSSGAAPIWAEVMAQLHAHQPSRAPAPPEGVVRQAVRFAASGDGATTEAARQEWFVSGTQQALFEAPTPLLQAQSTPAAASQPRIVQPVQGTVLALDPDIPPARQRLRLQASHAEVRWVVGGQAVGPGREQWWAPRPGRQVVQLYHLRGQLLDEITLEVRGAYVKNR